MTALSPGQSPPPVSTPMRITLVPSLFGNSPAKDRRLGSGSSRPSASLPARRGPQLRTVVAAAGSPVADPSIPKRRPPAPLAPPWAGRSALGGEVVGVGGHRPPAGQVQPGV